LKDANGNFLSNVRLYNEIKKKISEHPVKILNIIQNCCPNKLNAGGGHPRDYLETKTDIVKLDGDDDKDSKKRNEEYSDARL
jgi:hypothetical protein